jgi:hypothetical protein
MLLWRLAEVGYISELLGDLRTEKVNELIVES